MVIPSFTSTGPSVHFTHPPTSLLLYKPSSNPEALSPPVSDFTLARPFNISPELYNSALHVAVPITIAVLYATSVTYTNSYNKKRDHKPWPISKSLPFYIFVIAHNVFLAVYSAWTCIGMFNAIRNSWPGLNGPSGLAGAADALCKLHGPRGLGSAATYDTSGTVWGVTDRTIELAGSQPDVTDVGRIWNEGLAFYGWLFYLSKFYEVLDTVIILAKGKRSTTLQTFHHTGAMLCMWAGIRYMSPPIWMFVFINSGLHALMYTYYTLSALTIKVPRAMKQTLTTFQIIQIVFGGTYAFAHLFIAYDIPIEKPYLYIHNLSTALPSTVSTISSAVSSAFASATATAGLGSWLKKVALRAAGEEGLAENVRNYQGETFGIDAIHAAQMEKAQEEIRYRRGTQTVHCLDTSGEAFAILLNLVYLAPLAGLFIRYFTRSYMNRAKSEPPKPSPQENIMESSKDAVKDVEREIREAMAGKQGGATEPPPELKEKLDKAKSDAKQSASDMSAKAQKNANIVSAKTKKSAGDLGNKAQNVAKDLGAIAQDSAQDAKTAVNDDITILRDQMRKMGSEGTKLTKTVYSYTSSSTTKEESGDQSSEKPAAEPEEGESEVKDQEGGENEDKDPKKEEDEDKASEDKAVKDEPEDDGPKEDGPREDGPKRDGPKEDRPEEDEAEEEGPEAFNGDASAYEVVPDQPKTEEEAEAEAEMQPQEG